MDPSGRLPSELVVPPVAVPTPGPGGRNDEATRSPVDIDALSRDLLRRPTTSIVRNFYSDSPPADTQDPTGGPAARLDALVCHLRARRSAPLVLVGEAAGWRGARRTGVAFTSPYLSDGTGMREASAGVVQAALLGHGLDRDALLWNAFPWHPHPPGTEHANRAPGAGEVLAALPLLRQVVEGRRVVAVGRRAAAAAGRCLDEPVPGHADARPGAHAVAVRHPSHGGAAEFRSGLTAALVLFGPLG